MKVVAGRLGILTGAMLSFGLLLSAVAYRVAGFPAVEGLVYSVILCLIPGLLTVGCAELFKSTDASPYLVVAGGGLRMVFVFLGLFGVSALRPDLGFREFTVWLLASYLVALAVETAVVLTPGKADPVQQVN